MSKKSFVLKGAAVLIASIGILTLVLFNVPQASKTSLAKEVEKDYMGMETIINKAIEARDELAMSSNPYDYIEDNPYYDSLVEKGVEVLPILEEKLDSQEDNDGLMGYITAIAIEDITDCDLREDHNMGWATPEDFKKSWDKFSSAVTEEVNMIASSKVTEEEKVKQLKKYGVFAVPVLQNEKFKSDKTRKEARTIVKSYDFSDNELEIVKEYASE